jgi:hypothetical protein
METNPCSPTSRGPSTFAVALGSATAKVALAAVLLLVGGRAYADDHPTVTAIPGRLVVVRGVSFRNGDWFAFEPSGLVLLGAPDRGGPVVGVVRAVVGVAGSGGGIGLAKSLNPDCPCAVDDLAGGPFAILEGRIERTYGRTRWRDATYLGPHLSLSAYIFKISVGWMIDVNDRSDRHVQIGIGGGF